MRQKVSILKGVCRECRPTSGRPRCRADLRHIARADDAVAVAARVGVVAEFPWLLAERALRDRGVGAVDLAVAVDVLRGEVAGLAVGVVGDAEGEGAGAADGGDEAWELRLRSPTDMLAL